MADTRKYFEDAKKTLEDFLLRQKYVALQAKFAAEGRDRELGRAETASNLQAKGMSKQTDSKGNKLPYSALLDNSLNDALNSKLNTVNQWATAMMEFLHICELTVDTAHPEVGKKYYALAYAIQDKALTPAGHAIRTKWNSNPEVELPKLLYAVNTKDGKLNIDPLITYANGQPLSGDDVMNAAATKLNKLFEQGVDAWLRENNYVPDNQGVYKNAGTTLTSEALENLKKDPDHGFAKFLQTNSDLDFSPKP
jgi:hypothetical protein